MKDEPENQGEEEYDVPRDCPLWWTPLVCAAAVIAALFGLAALFNVG